MAAIATETEAGGGRLLAVDPGPTQSGWVVMRGSRPVASGNSHNGELLGAVRVHSWPAAQASQRVDVLVVEDIRSYGQPVGQEVFDCCMFIGALCEAWRRPAVQLPPGTHAGSGFYLVGRPEIKLVLCQTLRATQADVRAALLDRYGGTRAAAVGTKAKPGPLYDIRSHCWSALALAVAFMAGAKYREGTP